MLLTPGEGKEIVIGPTSMRIKTPANSEGLFMAFAPGSAIDADLLKELQRQNGILPV